MGFSFIREGDTTSHGGRVLACSPENKSDGVPLALLGDKVSCPKCGGIYPIVGVKNLGVTFDGRPVASEGDTTACGATLIASQNNTTAEPTSGPDLPWNFRTS
ncbi:PAAR motif family protein [Burkholderia pseudomallei HBPUB10303a]|nr:PAAR motif family protein [Burkholderia pseudomallei HBPUB10303a]CAJ7175657.1 PAAR repeat-containing protein [Burkholderia pseudomallei]CAJ7708516.1 PAAR repeat-containing protein [Burkholderia pseudomallei]CAK0463040.1 PAAR repeat-containing protein [Burkholderia pseudomallei]VBL29092.1 PAAR repeat-containing protein [Burkholderia pseudomallei]